MGCTVVGRGVGTWLLGWAPAGVVGLVGGGAALGVAVGLSVGLDWTVRGGSGAACGVGGSDPQAIAPAIIVAAAVMTQIRARILAMEFSLLGSCLVRVVEPNSRALTLRPLGDGVNQALLQHLGAVRPDPDDAPVDQVQLQIAT